MEHYPIYLLDKCQGPHAYFFPFLLSRNKTRRFTVTKKRVTSGKKKVERPVLTHWIVLDCRKLPALTQALRGVKVARLSSGHESNNDCPSLPTSKTVLVSRRTKTK